MQICINQKEKSQKDKLKRRPMWHRPIPPIIQWHPVSSLPQHMTSQSKSCLPNCSPLKLNTWESNIATRRLKLPAACLPVIDTSGQWLCYENKEVSMSNVGTAHLKAELETRTNHVVIAVLAEWPIVRAGSIIAINFTTTANMKQIPCILLGNIAG